MQELSEEIRKQYGGRGGVKAFIPTIEQGNGKPVNYFTYLGYLEGRTSMGADLLMESLTALGVDPLVFFTQLRLRVEAEQSHTEALPE